MSKKRIGWFLVIAPLAITIIASLLADKQLHLYVKENPFTIIAIVFGVLFHIACIVILEHRIAELHDVVFWILIIIVSSPLILGVLYAVWMFIQEFIEHPFPMTIILLVSICVIVGARLIESE